MSDNKRPASGDDSAAKKAKPTLTLNLNNAVDKEWETKTLREIAAAPVGAIQGVGDKIEEMLHAMKVTTVADLANWKFYKAAKAINILAATEEEGKRADDATANINHILDAAFETKTFAEIKEAPPSALQGLADWTDNVLKTAHLTTVEKLGNWKYAQYAEAIVELSKFETDGGH